MLAITVAFSSCGSDDDGPTPVRQEKDTTYVYTAVIRGNAYSQGDEVKYTLPDITLAQILGDTNASNFISGEFQNTGTYIEVSGLKDVTGSPSLKNFTLQVNSNSAVNFGTCKYNSTDSNEFSSDTQQYGNKYLAFINPIFSSVVGKSRKASLRVSFIPSKDILESDKVLLKIGIRAKYIYNTYPTTAK